MRMPQTLFQTDASRIPGHAGVNALDLEVMAEKAAVLGALGRRVETSLARLAAFDDDAGLPLSERAHRVTDAADAVWAMLVHQEACGVFDEDRILRDFAVPADVKKAIGAQQR
jgi:hypothetical protein